MSPSGENCKTDVICRFKLPHFVANNRERMDKTVHRWFKAGFISSIMRFQSLMNVRKPFCQWQNLAGLPYSMPDDSVFETV
jgi:hypothetical protein